MIALSKWFGKKHERESGNGLFVTLEELVGMRRYAVYLRGLRRRKTFSRQAGEVKSAFKGGGWSWKKSAAILSVTTFETLTGG